MHVQQFVVPAGKQLHAFPSVGSQPAKDVAFRERGWGIYYSSTTDSELKRNTKGAFLQEIETGPLTKEITWVVIAEDDGLEDGLCCGSEDEYEVIGWGNLGEAILARANDPKMTFVWWGSCYAGRGPAAIADIIFSAALPKLNEVIAGSLTAELRIDLASLRTRLASREFRGLVTDRVARELRRQVALHFERSGMLKLDLGVARLAAGWLLPKMKDGIAAALSGFDVRQLASKCDAADVKAGLSRALVGRVTAALGDRAPFLAEHPKLCDEWARKLALPERAVEEVGTALTTTQQALDGERVGVTAGDVSKAVAIAIMKSVKVRRDMKAAFPIDLPGRVTVPMIYAIGGAFYQCTLGQTGLARLVEDVVRSVVSESAGHELLKKAGLEGFGKVIDDAVASRHADGVVMVGTSGAEDLSFGVRAGKAGEASAGFATRRMLIETDGEKGNRALGVVLDAVSGGLEAIGQQPLCIWRGQTAISLPASLAFGESKAQLWPVVGPGGRYSDESGAFVGWPRTSPPAKRSVMRRDELEAIERALVSPSASRQAADWRLVASREECLALASEFREKLRCDHCKMVPMGMVEWTYQLAETALESAGSTGGARLLLENALEPGLLSAADPKEAERLPKEAVAPGTCVILASEGVEESVRLAGLVPAASESFPLRVVRRHTNSEIASRAYVSVSPAEFDRMESSGEFVESDGKFGTSADELARAGSSSSSSMYPLIVLERERVAAFVWACSAPPLVFFLAGPTATADTRLAWFESGVSCLKARVQRLPFEQGSETRMFATIVSALREEPGAALSG